MDEHQGNRETLQKTKEFQDMVIAYMHVQYRYEAAIKVVLTKLSILDDEFRFRHVRNPIGHMESRTKTPFSIVEKLIRKNFPVTIASAEENLTDIAGIRVICPYIKDIYTVAELLKQQDNVTVLAVRDYIKNPKPNGYRSLHLIVSVPVYLPDGKVSVPVEIQIRTFAMHWWATLEHEMRYKRDAEVTAAINQELLRTARDIAEIDLRMETIHGDVEKLEQKDPPSPLQMRHE